MATLRPLPRRWSAWQPRCTARFKVCPMLPRSSCETASVSTLKACLSWSSKDTGGQPYRPSRHLPTGDQCTARTASWAQAGSCWPAGGRRCDGLRGAWRRRCNPSGKTRKCVLIQHSRHMQWVSGAAPTCAAQAWVSDGPAAAAAARQAAIAAESIRWQTGVPGTARTANT